MIGLVYLEFFWDFEILGRLEIIVGKMEEVEINKAGIGEKINMVLVLGRVFLFVLGGYMFKRSCRFLNRRWSFGFYLV